MSLGDDETPAGSCPECGAVVEQRNVRKHQEWHDSYDDIAKELRRIFLAVRGRHTRKDSRPNTDA